MTLRHRAVLAASLALAAAIIFVTGSCSRKERERARPAPAVEKSISFDIPLGAARDLSGETMTFTVGIGSGACRRPGDPAGVVYAVTDRGPNIDADDYFEDHGRAKPEDDGKVFPMPDYTPTIYRLKLREDGVEALARLPIRLPDGRPATGICMPGTEGAWSAAGGRYEPDPDGLDVEAIAVLRDGSMWISEEYAPSLLRLDARGVIIERWAPRGVAPRLVDSKIPTVERLPAIVARRHPNRGIEGMAIDPKARYLYFVMQSPLDNPDEDAHDRSRNVRIFRVDLRTRSVDAEYLYRIDPVASFRDDDEDKQSKVKVSELSIDPQGRLVVLERVDDTTKLYRVSLRDATNLLGTRWDDPDTEPALEELNGVQLGGADIEPVSKTLLFDSARLPKEDKLPEKVEAVAPLGGGRWLLINDNDFGIDGDGTVLTILSLEAGP